MTELPFISVVIPVLNGAGRLEHCLESLRQQTYPQERFEIIVADGDSSDESVAIARRFGATVVHNGKRIAAEGRNLAVSLARGELIACTDDDIVLPSDWLAVGQRALQEARFVAVGGPTPLPETAGAFARAAYLIFEWASRVGYSVQSGHEAIGEARDIPGCNAMYRADVLRQFLPIKGAVAEDPDLHLRMRAAGHRLRFCHPFLAYHHKRDTLARFYRQIRHYGYGRAWLRALHPQAVGPLHWLAALAAPIGIGALTFSLVTGGLSYLLALVLIGVLVSLVLGYRDSRSLAVAGFMPILASTFLIAWSLGFLGEALLGLKPRALR